MNESLKKGQKGLFCLYHRGCGNDAKVKNLKLSQKNSVFIPDMAEQSIIGTDCRGLNGGRMGGQVRSLRVFYVKGF